MTSAALVRSTATAGEVMAKDVVVHLWKVQIQVDGRRQSPHIG